MKDLTLSLLKNPYGFISDEAKKRGADFFETRLLLAPVICMTGPESPELFYDESLFTRKGAAPEMLKATLVGVGGVQGLDGREHLHRKQMFMSLMTESSIQKLSGLMMERLEAYLEKWTEKGEDIVFYEEMKEILTISVCAWAGVPLAESEVKEKTRILSSMFQDAGSKGLGHLVSRISRKRSESWIRALVKKARTESDLENPKTPFEIICFHQDLHGELLSEKTATVEILNLLRPVVAVSVYMAFLAHALNQKPEYRQLIQEKGEDYILQFVQEVRRHYPFFPALMAKVKKDFEWKGFSFKAGRRVMLDLHGLNHDERIWPEPETFEPARFEGDVTPWKRLTPQGVGDHLKHHRCPGEFITVELMKAALRFLSLKIQYEVPQQDLRIDKSRLPALPSSRFIMKNMRRSDSPLNDTFAGYSATF